MTASEWSEPHLSKQKDTCLFTAASLYSTWRHFFREICIFQNRTGDSQDVGVDPEVLSTKSYQTNFTENSAGLGAVVHYQAKWTTWRHTLSKESSVPLPWAKQRPTHFTLDCHTEGFHTTVGPDISWVPHVSWSEYSVWLHRKGIVMSLCTVGRSPFVQGGLF